MRAQVKKNSRIFHIRVGEGFNAMLIMALDVDGCEDRGGKRRGGANGGRGGEGVGEEGEKGGQLFATRSWVRCTSRVSTLGLQCSRQGLPDTGF